MEINKELTEAEFDKIYELCYHEKKRYLKTNILQAQRRRQI